MKSTLKTTLGQGVYLLIELVLLGIIFVPLQYLNLPWWADALIAAFIYFTQTLGGLVSAVVWVWSFIIFVRSPFDTYSIIYLVFLVVYLAISFGLPALLSHLSKRREQ